MSHCAERLSGLLFVLPTGHPEGDFGFCQYRWSERERDRYQAHREPPRTLKDLPASTPHIRIYALANDTPGTSRGPRISSPQFKRINSCKTARLIIVDILQPEGLDIQGPLYVIPSDDLSAMDEHLDLHRRNLANRGRRMGRRDRVPIAQRYLHSGLAISDYVVGGVGPLLFGDRDGYERWADLWRLLDQFSGVETFKYPTSIARNPTDFHSTIREMHQRVAEGFDREPLIAVEEDARD